MSTWFDRDQRPIDDLLGEALYRHTHGAMRPLWADMQEAERKRWRKQGRAVFDAFASGKKPEKTGGAA